MSCGYICLILVFSFVGIQSQDYEGLEEVWVCTTDYDFDAISYGKVNKECFYSATPVPDPFNGDLFPDFSCHPGFDLLEMRRMYRRAQRMEDGCGPNFLEAEQEDYCHYFCEWFKIMYVWRDSYTLDLLDYQRSDYSEENSWYDRNYVDGNPKFWFRDSSDRLNEMFGEELGGTLMKKIKDECQPTLHRVFFEERHRCNSTEALEIRNCVNMAIGC